MENSLSLFLFIGVEDFKRVKAKQGLCHKKEEHAVNLFMDRSCLFLVHVRL